MIRPDTEEIRDLLRKVYAARGEKDHYVMLLLAYIPALIDYIIQLETGVEQ